MSDSGQRINYTLRPAKCVERKILRELLSKCETCIPIHEYRYIGFGSFYFSDFVLFHNQLNIDKMISIESSARIDRYNFNKPYQCIEILSGTAMSMLSGKIAFSEEKKDIIWLDYDDAFNQSMVEDMLVAAGKISAGSFLFTSFNQSLDRDPDNRLNDLKERFGDFLPQLDVKDINNETSAQLFYEILDAAIQKTISERNVAENRNLVARTFFFIKYRDGAPMLTIGYYFAEHDEWEKFVNSKVSHFQWFTINKVPQTIAVPCLTKAEIREINRFLPGTPPVEIQQKLPYLTLSDIEKYAKIYKYYPNFLDSQYYV